MKHFLANSNENTGFIQVLDFDERLLHEYSLMFYKGVTEGAHRLYGRI